MGFEEHAAGDDAGGVDVVAADPAGHRHDALGGRADCALAEPYGVAAVQRDVLEAEDVRKGVNREGA